MYRNLHQKQKQKTPNKHSNSLFDVKQHTVCFQLPKLSLKNTDKAVISAKLARKSAVCLYNSLAGRAILAHYLSKVFVLLFKYLI